MPVGTAGLTALICKSVRYTRTHRFFRSANIWGMFSIRRLEVIDNAGVTQSVPIGSLWCTSEVRPLVRPTITILCSQARICHASSLQVQRHQYPRKLLQVPFTGANNSVSGSQTKQTRAQASNTQTFTAIRLSGNTQSPSCSLRYEPRIMVLRRSGTGMQLAGWLPVTLP
jgi:hypothetical protein